MSFQSARSRLQPREREKAESLKVISILKTAELDFSQEENGPDAIATLMSANLLSDDLFKQELTVLERLEAMLDRAYKRLLHLKGMKEMLATSFLKDKSQQPKKLQFNKQPGVHPLSAA